MVSVESQLFSSCAMTSAAMTADCLRSGGYFAISRSIFFSDSADSRPMSDFAFPVIDVARGGFGRMPPLAVVGDDLPGIRVLADLRIRHGADRKEAQLVVGVVDDLVRRLRPAHRAADDVARADPARLGAVAQGSRARDDEEHLFLGAMAMEGAGTLARRHHVVRIAQGARAKERADARRAPLELVALGAVLEVQLVEIDDVLHRPLICLFHRTRCPACR